MYNISAVLKLARLLLLITETPKKNDEMREKKAKHATRIRRLRYIEVSYSGDGDIVFVLQVPSLIIVSQG